MQTDEKNRIVGGTLYLVATPVGNLADISERALKTLSQVSFIAAEDTRNTAGMLSRFGIRQPLVSYHEHNRRESGQQIIKRLLGGESCALVTDAGTPGISDPGEDIVALCAETGVPVTVIPGACAAVCALVLSGLPTGKFVFEGFLPASRAERRKALTALKDETRTVIFHEAPHKLRAALADMLEVFGADRRLSLCRELTKLNEETVRTTVGGAVKLCETAEPRGEYVLVLGGADKASAVPFWAEMDEKAHVGYYISQGMCKNDAIKAAAHDRGVPKNDIYRKMI